MLFTENIILSQYDEPICSKPIG